MASKDYREIKDLAPPWWYKRVVQVTLMISRPTKHPETGVYQFRRVVPDDLRVILGKREIKRSLKTKDPDEAKRRHAVLSAEIENQWANLRVGPQELTERRAHELASRIYMNWLDLHADNPSQPDGWLPEFFDGIWTSPDPLRSGEWDDTSDISLGEIMSSGMRRYAFKQADFAIEDLGLVIDEWSRLRLAKAFAAAIQRASLVLQRLSNGTLDPASFEEHLAEIKRDNADPAATIAKSTRAVQPPKSIKLMELTERWWAEAEQAGRKPSTYESYRNTIKAFAKFIGFDDAGRISPEDVIAFKDHRLRTPSPKTGTPPSAKTVKDSDLSALKTIFGWGVSNRLLSQNPASGITIRLAKPPRTRSKGFTETEARAILTAALNFMPNIDSPATASAKKWVPWICAFTGARVGEIGQLRKQDLRQENDLWILNITPEAGTVKTNQAREVVLHRQIVDLGFPDFVAECQDGHLFVKVGATGDVLGPLKGLTNRLAEFSRTIVKDRGVAPTQGWRHRFKTIGFEVGIQARILDVIQGHAPRNVSETYGEVSLRTIAGAIGRFPFIEVTSLQNQRSELEPRKQTTPGT